MADNLPAGRLPNRAMLVGEREGLPGFTKGERTAGLGVTVSPGAVSQAASGFFDALRRVPRAAAAASRFFVSTVTGRTWFGPNQPLPPQAQEPEQGVVGRALDYPFGFNLNIQPRIEDGGISFGQLRLLAEACDVVKAAIAVRKDEIEGFDWEFVPEDSNADPDSPEYKSLIAENTEFWERPDKEADWTAWLRKWLDDQMTIDAVAVYPERTRGGQVFAMQILDGATIKRVINEYGRTPVAPDPAYQQIIKGFPAVDYTREELFYSIREPRTWKLYGNSPVEQLITTINLALRRTHWQLTFYTEGTVPEALVSLPKEWSANQIAEFQAYFDQMLAGNIAERRRVRFIPSADKLEFPKSELLKDEFDDYLVRLVCFAFRVSPQALMKQMNRASAEQASDTAKEQGLMPTLRFLERQINRLNRDFRGVHGIKFAWKIEELIDPLKQAQERQIYVASKILLPDEVREDMGYPAITPEQREAAWPTPPAPIASGATDDPFADDSPIGKLLKRIQLQAGGDQEHMVELVKAHGDSLIKAVRAMKPNVVELKPRVAVRVGDVRVEARGADRP